MGKSAGYFQPFREFPHFEVGKTHPVVVHPGYIGSRVALVCATGRGRVERLVRRRTFWWRRFGWRWRRWLAREHGKRRFRQRKSFRRWQQGLKYFDACGKSK